MSIAGSPVIPDRLLERLTAWAYLITRCWFLAEDAVQDAQVALLETERPPPAERRVPWLYRVVRYKAIDHLRRAGRAISMDTATLDRLGEGHAGVAEVAEVDELDEDSSRLREAVLNLPLDQREAWLLRMDHHLSYDAMAEILEVGKSALYTRICRALKRLREHFDQDGLREGDG